MSQSPFGGPSPFGQIPSQPGPTPSAPAPAPEFEEPGRSRTKLLILGGAGLAALVLAGGAALVLTSGGDDGPDLAGPLPKPAATSSPSTTQAPAPLPTSVQFAGRNPFKAKIVEGTGGGGGGAATGGGSTGSTAEPTTAPGGSTGGLGGGTTVFVPGPTVTKTVVVPGPTTTTPGPERTVYVSPGEINLTYLGTDLPDPAPEDMPADFVPDDPALADFEVNGEILQDLNEGDVFAYYFQLLGAKQDDEGDQAWIRFGDQIGWVLKDEVQHF